MKPPSAGSDCPFVPLSLLFCEAPRTRYLTIPWITKNQIRRRYERCSRRQQTQKRFTWKSSVTQSVLFTQTNQAKCRACSVLSTYWLFPLPWDGKITKKTNFLQRTKVATDATSKNSKFTKDFDIKVVTSSLHSKLHRNTRNVSKHHIFSQTPQNCMTTSEIETGNALRLKPSLLQRQPKPL